MCEDDLFGKGVLKHGVKLMYLRKNAEKAEIRNPPNDEHEPFFKIGISCELYGHGTGLEHTGKLHFWKKFEKQSSPEEDWEVEDDETHDGDKKKGKNDSDSDYDIETEDFLEMFIMENSKENKSRKMNCRFCKNKKFSYDGLKKHFIKTHQKEFEKSEFIQVSWEKAIEINENNEKLMEEEFMNDDMFDMFGMGGGKPGKPGKGGNNMMKEIEKMMDMMMEGGMGMGMGGGSKKKRGEKR
jgi:hypothetical protein